jgi:hypothetical protein
MDLVGSCPTEQACIRIARSRNEIWQALSLVYENYLESGLIEPNPLRARVLRHHALRTTEVLVARVRNEVFATASVIRDSALGFPIESVYPREIEWLRTQGLNLAEVSCLADRRGQTSRSAVNDLMAFIAQSAKLRGVDQLLIAVHPRHAKFYSRFLGFEVFGGLRDYEAVRGNPAVGLCLDLNNLRVHSPTAYDRLFGRPHPMEHLAYRPLPRDARRYVNDLLTAVPCYEPASYQLAAMAS